MSLTIVQTVAPGSRLGWFTCAPLFAERLERQGETTTQAPCGFGQVRHMRLMKAHYYSRLIAVAHHPDAH
jgi:aromatic amino acid aminotransferase I